MGKVIQFRDNTKELLCECGDNSWHIRLEDGMIRRLICQSCEAVVEFEDEEEIEFEIGG